MELMNEINPRFIVSLDKFSIGLPHAEVIDTKGKYLVFRASMAVDNTLYKNRDCSTVVDAEFVNKIIGLFADGYVEEQNQDMQYAIGHKLWLKEVDEYKTYCESTDSPLGATEWRNLALNKKHGTWGEVYTFDPPESYYERLEDALSYGEYRLGVFIN